MLHIRKDYEERAEIVKVLGTLINPSAFSHDTQKVTVHKSTSVQDEVASRTGLSGDDIARILSEDARDLEQDDPIERVF